MKKVLITGANSYIGTSFETYLKQRPDKYIVDTVDMIDGSWRDKSFCGYDTIYHVAGIAHSDTGKVTDEQKTFYYKINTDLAIETAQKAKLDGVSQFIFMSSAIVYGDSAPIGQEKVITINTPLSPSNFYGNSKIKAEEGIQALSSDTFKVVILRPPVIYGKGCKGNYQELKKIAIRLPVFPYVNNQRSMLYIENAVEFVRLMVENEEKGIFWPQNNEYTNTSEMVKMIEKANGKSVMLVKGFTWIIKILSFCTPLINKAFGNNVYDEGISKYKENYQLVGLKESIDRTEL